MSDIDKVWFLLTSTGGNVDKEFTDWSEACKAAKHWAAKNPNITYYVVGLEKVFRCKPVEIDEIWPNQPKL